MKKTFALLAVGILSACSSPTDAVSELNGKPVYQARFTRELNTPHPTLDQAYEVQKQYEQGWIWKECPNGMTEISRVVGQGSVYPTAYTKRVVRMYRVLYQCK
ncbi:hypothetical protein GCM10022404_03550 [Celeribacter arenosi]|uniref:Lipoprotein n=1 Tax=Celeribacter arenosi TaxID=792649 RepID=A0ABP7JW29_9RHOB